MARFLASILLLALWPGVATAQAQSKPSDAEPQRPCELTVEDYDVYTSVLADVWEKANDPEGTLRDQTAFVYGKTTVSDTPRNDASGQWFRGELFRSEAEILPSQSTLDNFDQQIRKPCSLDGTRFKVPHSLQIISADEIENPSKMDSAKWKTFREKHPGAGFLELSSPGYDPSHTEAVLLVISHCKGLCGLGELYLLRKRGSKWEVKNRLVLWMS